MKRLQIITTAFLAIYLLLLIFTDLSLTGYWTDVVFTLLLVIFALIVVYRKKTDSQRLTNTLRRVTLSSSILVFLFMSLAFVNPFAWGKFQMRHFKNVIVEGRHFNAYFIPVGAWGRGYGSFWITESPRYFPVIEWTVYFNRQLIQISIWKNLKILRLRMLLNQ